MITVFFSDGIHSAGINFAIPSNTLKKVIKELKDQGKVRRSWLGVGLSPLSKKAAHALGLGKRSGCVISRVEKNSPAVAAGLQTGDILISLNDEAISENTNLEFTLSVLPIGKVIPIQIIRHGAGMKLSVMVGIRDNNYSYSDTDDFPEKKEILYEKIDGIELGATDLIADLRKSFDIPDGISGPLISYVENPQSDLPMGGVILSVNQANVLTVADLKAELRKLAQNPAIRKDKELALYIFDPQSRRSDYVVVDFDPTLGANKESKGTSSASKSGNDIMDKLKDGLKTKWHLIQ
jgi:serine protease Do